MYPRNSLTAALNAHLERSGVRGELLRMQDRDSLVLRLSRANHGQSTEFSRRFLASATLEEVAHVFQDCLDRFLRQSSPARERCIAAALGRPLTNAPRVTKCSYCRSTNSFHKGECRNCGAGE